MSQKITLHNLKYIIFLIYYFCSYAYYLWKGVPWKKKSLLNVMLLLYLNCSLYLWRRRHRKYGRKGTIFFWLYVEDFSSFLFPQKACCLSQMRATLKCFDWTSAICSKHYMFEYPSCTYRNSNQCQPANQKVTSVHGCEYKVFPHFLLDPYLTANHTDQVKMEFN